MLKNKKWLIIGVVVVMIIGVGSYLIYSQSKKVNDFDILNYRYEVNNANYKYDKSYEKVNSKDKAIEVAKEVWTAKFGKESINQKPYLVYFDSSKEAWLVKGSVTKKNKKTPYLIVNKTDGKILAVWYE